MTLVNNCCQEKFLESSESFASSSTAESVASQFVLLLLVLLEHMFASHFVAAGWLKLFFPSSAFAISDFIFQIFSNLFLASVEKNIRGTKKKGWSKM